MQYIGHYTSPMGEIVLAADDIGLTGLWFVGQKYFGRCLEETCEERETPVLKAVKKWLDLYFAGERPVVTFPLHFAGTSFQNEVWQLLLQIPYGQTTTYGRIAKELAARRGVASFSAQAVGGAVGRNEISIIVPCHRVLGANGALTGYAGGIDKKIALLKLEGVLRGPES